MEGATVIDVGGDSCATAATLATAYPMLLCRNTSQKHFRRIDLQKHNMFKEQPVKGAEIYLLRTIIHDWPDEEAISILRRLVAAMEPHSHLVIMDVVLPVPEIESPH
ncbi:hypothetical protein LEMA_P012630.1 [Plenodomus lingam JN3]|uniref:O-methyltransferase C-terminal domain-containing protein n=1 Tax=Leptosphaeria maculans (strain JN3 / isolate v23.1.3 / race Av1-4-5-6-7-8) TaxID=985895 RepID=E5ADC4_LEPMJ|nr:hypothetical protein LEMA_P012630.1 [Plenodomus lingam JN3]CBY02476.1 hypothetical protein LEMA_P012630.1 [Plenodomus lingam JN3]